MKKLFASLAVVAALCSCNWTTIAEDTQMLQSKYPLVYRLEQFRYVCADSVHIYDVRVKGEGTIESIVIIK